MKNKKKLFIVLSLIYLFLGSISLITKNIHLDEIESHLPTTVAFFNGGIASALVMGDYRSASGPLPYILVAGLHKFINIEPTVITVRLMNIFISLITILLFFSLINRNTIIPIHAVFILLFYPYFEKPSFFFYMAIYGLLFYLLFLLFLEKVGAINKFICGVALSMSILSQQFYLILLAPFGIRILNDFFNDRDKKKFLMEQFLFFIPLTAVAGLFFLWGGLTHPSYKSWGVEFRLEYLTAVLVVIGGTLLPFSLFKLKEINGKLLFILIFTSLSLSLFAFPSWVNSPTVGGIAGYTFHSIAIAENTNSYLGLIVRVSLVFLGLVSVFMIVKYNLSQRIILLFFIFLIVGFTINKLPSERHMLPMVVTGYLLAFPHTEEKILKRLWMPYQVVLGIIYFFYINFTNQMG